MKLHKNTRSCSKVYKTYDRARAPFQRLRESGILQEKTAQELQEVHSALDPVALLQPINVLQNALWQHVVLPAAPLASGAQASAIEHDKRFEIAECGSSGNLSNTASDKALSDAGIKSTRRYRRKNTVNPPRWWRTRQDPFEEVWSDISTWLEQSPERTAKSLLVELQERYPGTYKDNQLRTLQRRVQEWRANTIIVFHEACLHRKMALIQKHEPDKQSDFLRSALSVFSC